MDQAAMAIIATMEIATNAIVTPRSPQRADRFEGRLWKNGRFMLSVLVHRDRGYGNVLRQSHARPKQVRDLPKVPLIGVLNGHARGDYLQTRPRRWLARRRSRLSRGPRRQIISAVDDD